MSSLLKFSAVCVLSVGSLLASSITFEGPFGLTDGSVIGPHQYFDLQDAILTQPTTPGGDWTLTVHTNYGAGLPGPAGDVIPDFRNLAASDFLISWNGGFYGIVLHSHDGYAAGDLYQSNGFLTPDQVLHEPSSPLINHSPVDEVWLAAGGSLLGTGTVSAAPYGDGVSKASFTITDTFQAPASFLSSGDFTIQMSSADCANGYMTGTGSSGGGTIGGGTGGTGTTGSTGSTGGTGATGGTGGGPGGTPVPEPGTLLLLAPALLLICRRRQEAR